MVTIDLLPLGTSLLRLHRKIDADWHQTPRISVTRTITKGDRAKDGPITETIIRRGKRAIVDGAKATAIVLLKKYWKRVERLVYSPMLFDTMVTDTGILMPSILVDARMLMQERSLTERTMRNHLAQLMKIGFIVRKKWHGRKRQFELWINPELILKEQAAAVETPQPADSQFSTISTVLSTNGIKFPAIELPELQEALKNKIGQCGEIPREPSSERPSQEAEDSNQAGSGQRTAKNEAGAGGAAKPGVTTPEPEDATTAARRANWEAYVVPTYLFAKARLWPEHNFNPHQELLAKRAIWRGVYLNFDDPTFDYDAYFKDVLRRIELVERFIMKHVGSAKPRYIPMPWAEMVKGMGYFDWENEQGFKGTMAWLQSDRQLEHLARVNREVKKALNELKLRRKIDRGEKTTRKPVKHIEGTSFGQLYRFHEQRLEQLGGTRALNKYQPQVMELLKNLTQPQRRQLLGT
ncbi:hypothetical protein [Hymenobacter crusticola]|uniref:Uncharacterized protein n=1 Tax=Hymenobacter crusticola TaxID=1770526 RepID=A0A243W5C5_9BACT|nr:hypothetical protein [Hymenobacter crusticola]OUJ68605.1 hypothetical protein BXP70_27805 [Hymenobacter crusticola]